MQACKSILIVQLCCHSARACYCSFGVIKYLYDLQYGHWEFLGDKSQLFVGKNFCCVTETRRTSDINRSLFLFSTILYTLNWKLLCPLQWNNCAEIDVNGAKIKTCILLCLFFLPFLWLFFSPWKVMAPGIVKYCLHTKAIPFQWDLFLLFPDMTQPSTKCKKFIATGLI